MSMDEVVFTIEKGDIEGNDFVRTSEFGLENALDAVKVMFLNTPVETSVNIKATTLTVSDFEKHIRADYTDN